MPFTKKQLFTIPNAITLFRLLLIIPFGILLSFNNLSYALILFVIITVMDKIDGVVARAANQRTTFGELFDSLSDWIVIVVSSGLGFYFGYIPSFFFLFYGVTICLFILLKVVYIKQSGSTSSTWMGKVSVVSSYLVVFAYLTTFQYALFVYWGCVVVCFVSLIVFFFKSLNPRKNS